MITAWIMRAPESGRLWVISVAAISCISSAPASVPTIRTRPPDSGVPPTTTAVIALSSMSLPDERRIAGAQPRGLDHPGQGGEQAAHRTYTAISVRRTGRPARTLASGCRRSRPRSGRTSSGRRAIADEHATASTISTTIGMPTTRPLPIAPRVGSKISVSRPSANTSASPRPATSRPRVATIGWMPKTRDQHAVDHADGPPPSERHRDRRPRPVPEVQRQERRRDRHDRADRQVDPLGPDDQRHAERHDRDRHDLDQLQPDVVDLGEVRREHQVEGDQQQQPDVDAALGDPVEDRARAASTAPAGPRAQPTS